MTGEWTTNSTDWTYACNNYDVNRLLNCDDWRYRAGVADEDSPARIELVLAWAREAIARLVAWHSRVLEPWLIVGKRFDFRSAPRWRRGRFKAKT